MSSSSAPALLLDKLVSIFLSSPSEGNDVVATLNNNHNNLLFSPSSSCSPSCSENSESQQNLPTHIVDPFNWYETFTLGTIFAASFFYLSVILHNRFYPKLNHEEFGARILSFLHALVVSVFCVAALALHRGGSWEAPATRLQGHVCMFSFAYFLVDSIIMIIWKFDLMFAIHHLIALRWLSLTALQGELGYGGVAGLLAAELTNPLMHLRWLIHSYTGKNEIANGKYIKPMMKVFFPLFFVCRMLVIPGLLVMNYHLLPVDIIVILTLFTAASVQFFVENLKMELKGQWWEG